MSFSTAAPHRFDGAHQSVSPFCREVRGSAKLTPVVAEAFDVWNCIIGVGLVKLFQPFASDRHLGRRLGNDWDQRSDGSIDGITNGTG